MGKSSNFNIRFLWESWMTFQSFFVIQSMCSASQEKKAATGAAAAGASKQPAEDLEKRREFEVQKMEKLLAMVRQPDAKDKN